MKPRILIFCDYYLPGHKSGGGMWTVVNLVERFSDRFEFHIVTRNHDGREDKRPYSDVRTGEWNEVGNASVFYVNSQMISQRRFAELIAEVKPDIVFLNSVFATPAVKFLALRRRNRLYDMPVILAPCGELAPAALKLKSVKKRAFLGAARAAALYRDVIWKASAEAEADEIRNVFGKDVTVLIAPDLPPRAILPNLDVTKKPEKQRGAAKFIFVSRITPKKNLDFLLRSMATLNKGEIDLEIVGPAEDKGYWGECRQLIARLPPNINVSISGAMRYEEVLERLTQAHYFVLPTRNENFGYVFVEAMAAGCPLIISDRTIWNGLEELGIGRNIPLDSQEAWSHSFNEFVEMDPETFIRMSAAARDYAVQWLRDPAVENATADVLAFALERSPSSK